MLAALWNYRSFILVSVYQEIRSRYAGSLLGMSWAVLNPLMMIVIYTVIFSQIMHARLPSADGGAANTFAYSVYLCAGMLPWGYFTEILLRMQSVFVDHATLIKKTSIPRICLPAIVLGSASVSFGIVYAIFILFLLVSSQFPGLVILLVVPALIIQTVFAIGLGLLLGTLNVFFRDVGHTTAIVLQLAFWFTPIVYPLSIVPDWARGLLGLNPMLGPIEFYHQIFLKPGLPDPALLTEAAVLSIVCLSLGLLAYRRLQGEIPDNV